MICTRSIAEGVLQIKCVEGVPGKNEYFDAAVPLKAIEAIYAHARLTKELLKQIRRDRSIDELAGDLAEIGYPVAGSAST